MSEGRRGRGKRSGRTVALPTAFQNDVAEERPLQEPARGKDAGGCRGGRTGLGGDAGEGFVVVHGWVLT